MSEKTFSSTNTKPGLVSAIAYLTLINGIGNIFWGIILPGMIIGWSSGFALFCLPLILFTIMPSFLGIFEIIYAAKLLTTPSKPIQPSPTLAKLAILTILTANFFSMIVGILSLVFYNDQQVKEYFARLNGIQDSKTPDPEVPNIPAAPALTPPQVPDRGKSTPKPKKPATRKVASGKSDPKPAVKKTKSKAKAGNSSS